MAGLAKTKSFPRRKPQPPVLWTSVTPTTDTAHQVSFSDPCYLDWCSCESQCLSVPEEGTPDTGDEEVEPSEPSSRTCQYRFRVSFLLTHTSCEKRPDSYRSRSWWHFVGHSGGGFRCIRSSQSHPGCHLRHLRELRSMSTVLHVKCTPDGPVYRGQSPSGEKYKASAHA